MIYLYLFGTCFHFIYVFMIIAKIKEDKKIIFSLNLPFKRKIDARLICYYPKLYLILRKFFNKIK